MAYRRVQTGRGPTNWNQITGYDPQSGNGGRGSNVSEDRWRELYANRGSIPMGSRNSFDLILGANKYNPAASGKEGYAGTNDTLPDQSFAGVSPGGHQRTPANPLPAGGGQNAIANRPQIDTRPASMPVKGPDAQTTVQPPDSNIQTSIMPPQLGGYGGGPRSYPGSNTADPQQLSRAQQVAQQLRSQYSPQQQAGPGGKGGGNVPSYGAPVSMPQQQSGPGGKGGGQTPAPYSGVTA